MWHLTQSAAGVGGGFQEWGASSRYRERERRAAAPRPIGNAENTTAVTLSVDSFIIAPSSLNSSVFIKNMKPSNSLTMKIMPS